MKKFFVAALAVGAALSLGCAQAKAESATVADGITLSVGYLGYHMHYSENVPTLFESSGSVNAKQLGHDSENGWMNGFYVNLGYLSGKETFLGKFKTDLEFQYAHNSLNYNGSEFQTYYQDPSNYLNLSTQYSSSDPATIFNIELKPGFEQNLSKNFSLSEYAIFGYRHWIRDMESTSTTEYITGQLGGSNFQYAIPKQIIGYEESYVNGYLGIGSNLKAYYNNFSAGLDFSVRWSPKWSSINYMYALGNKFKMGNALNLEVAVPIAYNFNEHFSVEAKPFYSYWRFQQSNWVNGYMEPDSETNSLGLKLGLNYKF